MLETITKPVVTPTGMTADNLKSISAEEKRRLLAELLAKKAAQPQQHPLSFGQERLWFLDQLEGGGSGAYNIMIALGLEGELNEAALVQGINEIVRRHAVLRTTFQSDKAGNPVAMVAPTLKVALPLVAIHSADEAAIQAFLTAQVDQPFDLQAGPLLRAYLLQLATHHHILVWVVHHAVFDGFSIAVWTQELSALYTAFTHHAPYPLAELALQYHDFARWQRQQSSEALLQQQLDYWKQQLAGAPPLLILPTDQPRPVVQTTNGRTYRQPINPQLTQALKRLSQETGVTLFTVLQSAFVVLLARYSGQQDIVIGTAVTSRSRPQFESLIGFLVNTLALRQDLTDNPTFLTLLKRVQQTTRQALIHQDLPFEKLVSALDPERNTSHAPIVQVAISWTEALTKPGGFGDLVTTPFPVNSTTSQNDLTLLLSEVKGLLASTWVYNSDLFAPETIARMFDHLVVLLENIVKKPDQPVLQLPMLTQAEYHQLVYLWNTTGHTSVVDADAPQTIQALFEQQVARTPAAIALVCEAEQLTYAQLNARANQLAHHLLALGVKADTLVVVAMHRSIELVVSLLAVLKAGGAYVPVDPTYPSERIRYMLADSAAPIVLTQSQLLPDYATAYSETHVIAVDEVWAHLAGQPDHNPQIPVTADQLVYVIYTSGSTGQPKGAGVYHHSFMNLLNWFITAFGLHADDSVLLISSPSFDLTQKNIFAPLLFGGRLHLLSAYDPAQIAQTIFQHKITWINCTPSAFYPLIERGHDLAAQRQSFSQLHSLRHLFLGGEPISITRLQPWMQAETFQAEIVNTYGPTECSDICAAYVIAPDFTEEVVPIGRPIDQAQLFILDTSLQPTPIGIAGELHIGGKGLGRGYLNQPELTATRFIQHPTFGRLYKTGDLCRWLPDGNIEYVGRADFQVKIRGFRIELGEIENALLAQAGVREGVVLVREDAGEKRLVAYVVGYDELDPEILHQQLVQQLPEYMIPTAFVILTAMPLTPNGKLDRRALPAPDYANTQTAFVAPRNEMEATFAQAFAAVLRIPQIGIYDNFFHMGGDSILILQLVNRAAQQGYTVRVKDLFQHPTVAQLASAIRNSQHSGEPQVLAAQDVQLGDAPLLPIQQRFLDANHPAMHHSNQPFLLTVKAPIAPAQLHSAIKALLSHHDALRFQYDQDGSGWHQRYLAPKESIPLEIVDLQAVAPADRPATIEAIGTQTQSSLNPLTGDLVRFVYFTTGDGDETGARLLLAIHHLATDGVSRRILMEDLTTLLEGGQLPPKTSSYRAWAETLQAATHNGHFDADLRAWLDDGQDGTTAMALPMDDPAAPNTMGSSHYVALTLAETQTEHLLRTLPRQHDVTLDAVLLTALTETLTRWSGQPGLCIQLESYGRQELFDTINLNRTVGWFTSIYPMTIARVAGSAVQRIRATQERLGRVTNGGISFGALRYYHLDPAIRQQLAALSAAPVMYNNFSQLASLDNSRFGAAQESPGLRVAPSSQRNTLIDCDILVINQQLYIGWRVSPQIQRATAEALLDAFGQQLDTLVAEALM